MAAGAAAALLDELMGRDRNLAPSEQRSETHWSDPEVCKYFLCGFCPHELFVNTRADLGPCDKIHDDLLRKEYVKSTRFERMGYEDDFMRFLQGLISDVEKRIRRGHMRLALNSTQGSLNGNLPSQKEEKITMLTEKINELVNQAEQLGCEGKVEEAQGVMKLCDQLREERRQLENNETGAYYTDPEKTLEVCGCCSALLVVGDAQQRIDEHLMGKQHMGYARIRAFLEEHKQKKIQADMDEREAKEAKLAQEREEREKEREKEREDRRKKEKEKEDEKKREREKEREKRRKRSRSRSRRSRSRERRSRSRDRRRSSSRDRKRRSRSRSRHRHRSRSRDRHKSSRHRSRSRSRGRRSRSRDRRSRSRGHRSRSRDRRSRSRGKSRRSRSRDKRSRSRDKSSRKRSRSRDKNRKSREKGKKSEEKDYNGRQSTEKDREEEREKVNEKDTNTKISETKTPSENDKTEETPMEQETKTPAAIESEGDSKYDA
ncbi:luc7-like protein 3 isoform X1 [Haliotis rufescens]|uniref:luc7-like protein 3 isoform X1 n=1 Tax=Haliotis rufescens TaxID=6454 RepID=UPI001EB00F92|nr:luc7-like protein 3 isoform X1 [Haliotis rufescens]XP_046369989.1 luc7-like protein 3 isoform X1 [Haliotis rufescens]XP_046369990.1 luc7-like protein 3 isoform X1 [Haliotis rufescens]